MKITKTEMDGLILLEPCSYQDKRGCFYESWRQNEYKQVGILEEFLQDNVSISYKNVLKGMHLRKDQGQLVTVVHGKIYDVAVDLRENSKNYKKYFAIELEGENPKQLYMPPGFAHGFCVLSEIAIINYKCTQYYDSSYEEGIRWDDPQLNIAWPGKEFIISDRDLKLDLLQ